MRIQNITPQLIFGVRKSYQNTQQPKEHRAMHDSINTASAWFGFGVGLDFLSRKLQFSKSPMKNSLAINGILGAGAGIYTAVQNKLNKN